jgi:hypothetical protein
MVRRASSQYQRGVYQRCFPGLNSAEISLVPDEAYRSEFQGMLDVVESGNTDQSGLRAGLRVLEILHAMYESSRQGRPIEVYRSIDPTSTRHIYLTGGAAVVAAARHGKQVLLVERYGFLGGTGASVLDSFYGFFIPGRHSRRVVGGIPWEVVQALQEEKAMLLRPNSYGAGTAVTYNPEILKVVWDRLVLAAGAKVLLHTLCTGVKAVPDGWQIQLNTRTELRVVHARLLIDASGDAQIATWAGTASEPLDQSKLQALTTTFRLVNVDTEQANAVKHHYLSDLMEEAYRQGYNLPRREGSIQITPIAAA